jgi:GTP-binding protein
MALDTLLTICISINIASAALCTSTMQVALDEARIMGLDDALEYITDDEQVEVTPQSIRIRKDPSAKPTRGRR